MKQYKVIGDRETLGYQPGETFSMDLPEAQEQRLMQRGALEVTGDNGSEEAEEYPLLDDEQVAEAATDTEEVSSDG